MSEKIEPALTAEQWAETVVELPDEHAWIEPGYLCANDNDRWGTSRVPAHIAIALANAALPDDDPRKFTQADIDNLRAMPDGTGYASIDAPEWFASLIARIAALLPPM